jgi:hypothetical protein
VKRTQVLDGKLKAIDVAGEGGEDVRGELPAIPEIGSFEDRTGFPLGILESRGTSE